MGKALIIGCGGVASVAIHKCCQNSEMFPELVLASRTVEKCDALVEQLKGKTNTVLSTAKVDADQVGEVVALIRRVPVGASARRSGRSAPVASNSSPGR